jgi:hypothetical protein
MTIRCSDSVLFSLRFVLTDILVAAAFTLLVVEYRNPARGQSVTVRRPSPGICFVFNSFQHWYFIRRFSLAALILSLPFFCLYLDPFSVVIELIFIFSLPSFFQKNKRRLMRFCCSLRVCVSAYSSFWIYPNFCFLCGPCLVKGKFLGELLVSKSHRLFYLTSSSKLRFTGWNYFITMNCLPVIAVWWLKMGK